MARILVLGGAGYVGSELTKRLTARGDDVTVFDAGWYALTPDAHFVRGDVRNVHSMGTLQYAAPFDTVIHLACISNDPSSELNPALTYEVNYACFHMSMLLAKQSRASHFIYASSSSVYGVQSGSPATEDADCVPLTDYSSLKLMCEGAVAQFPWDGAKYTILRPATVSGWSDRMRLDVIVNALTASAVRTGVITVHGGEQMRATVHIQDMVDAYVACVDAGGSNATYNVGAENYSVSTYAHIVAEAMQDMITVRTEAVRDPRSYSIDSSLIQRELGWRPTRTTADAVREIRAAMRERSGTDWDSSLFYNVKRMKELCL